MGDEYCGEHSGNCARIDLIKEVSDRHEERLHALEQAVWKAAGATGIIAGLVTAGAIHLLKI